MELKPGTMGHASGDVKTIAELVVAARRPSWEAFPGHDERKQLIGADGSTIGDPWIPPRRYEASSVEGLKSQLDAFKVVDWTVFIGSGSVVAVMDEDDDRQDRITLPLLRTESFVQLSDARSCLSDKDQKEMEWKLRSTFAGRVQPATFAPTIRQLKWKSDKKGASDVSHGRETVDLSVEQELSGIESDGFPEVVTIQTPVYEEIALMGQDVLFGIQCAVRVNVADRTFTLKPLEGEVGRAENHALELIATEVRAWRDGRPGALDVFVASKFGT